MPTGYHLPDCHLLASTGRKHSYSVTTKRMGLKALVVHRYFVSGWSHLFWTLIWFLVGFCSNRQHSWKNGWPWRWADYAQGKLFCYSLESGRAWNLETLNETRASMRDHVGVVFCSLSAVKSIKRFGKAGVEKQEETVFPADLLCRSLGCCCSRRWAADSHPAQCNLSLAHLTCPVPLPTPRLLKKH